MAVASQDWAADACSDVHGLSRVLAEALEEAGWQYPLPLRGCLRSSSWRLIRLLAEVWVQLLLLGLALQAAWGG